jgi:hypothetical protein
VKIENIHVYGFKSAFHGMRNPKESWSRSDSFFYDKSNPSAFFDENITCLEYPAIGPNDLQLASNLVNAGPDHRKFMRQIMIWWDITIPRYIWQELDTFKVATVRNSCSTMHKLGSRDLEPSDFQDEDVDLDVLRRQNEMGLAYRNKVSFEGYEGNKLLAHMKRRLPEAFLQTATYSFSYETALHIYLSRLDHRMSEWQVICSYILSLPYFKNFIPVCPGCRKVICDKSRLGCKS